MAEPEDFTDDNVQFIASNGMKFYISKLITKDDLKFYLVFVDINGSKNLIQLNIPTNLLI